MSWLYVGLGIKSKIVLDYVSLYYVPKLIKTECHKCDLISIMLYYHY